METTILDLLGVELKRALGKTESFLNQSGELANSATLVSENVLGVRSPNDDLSSGVGDSDLTARVSLLGELAGEELVELGGKDTVSYELWVGEEQGRGWPWKSYVVGQSGLPEHRERRFQDAVVIPWHCGNASVMLPVVSASRSLRWSAWSNRPGYS